MADPRTKPTGADAIVASAADGRVSSGPVAEQEYQKAWPAKDLYRFACYRQQSRLGGLKDVTTTHGAVTEGWRQLDPITRERFEAEAAQLKQRIDNERKEKKQEARRRRQANATQERPVARVI